MKSLVRQRICLVVLFLLVSLSVQAQKGDSTWRRNTIKVDLTSYWLYRDALVFSYERVVKNKPYQTWAITAGIQEFPALQGTLSDTVLIKRQNKALGYKVGGEYRFYLKKENKYEAPHGVYIGPYTSFHHYMNGRSIEVNNNGNVQNGNLETNLDILNIGVQLGYQFVLSNRWTIDMVFIGPSVSNYRFKASMDGNFTFDPDDITNEVILDLIDKYPGFKDLLTEGEFVSQGKVNKWAYGYRFQLQVGYHFGRKKK
jgi:hypothetical protein